MGSIAVRTTRLADWVWMVSDTPPKARKKQEELFKRLSGEEKLLIAMAWSDAIRDIAWAGFCQRHAGIPEERLHVMFIEELHGIRLPSRSR